MEFKSVRIPEADIESKLAELDQEGWDVLALSFHERREVVGASVVPTYAYGAGGGGGGNESPFGYGGGGGGARAPEPEPIYGRTIPEFVVVLRRQPTPDL